MQAATRSPATWSARAIRTRRLVNLLTLATPIGLLLARRHGVAVVRGPYGLLVADGYPARFPAPRNMAVTIGDVVLLRASDAYRAAHPRLLDHEARHAVQWACWLGPVFFLPAYGVASAWSWLTTRHPALRNAFEVRAGLVDGGYVKAVGGGSGGGGGTSF